MEIRLQQGEILDQKGDLLVVHVFKGFVQLNGAAALANKALGGKLLEMLNAMHFEGSFGEWFLVPTLGQLKAKRVAVIGLGEKKDFTVDAVRRIGALIAKRARDARVKQVVTVLPGVGLSHVTARDGAEAFAEGLRLGSYRFHAYKGKPQKEKVHVEEVIVCENGKAHAKMAEHGFADAKALCAATMLARDLVNTPSAEMTPLRMAEIAKEIAGLDKRVSIKLLDQAAMEKLGMRAALAVARGSDHLPIGVHLIYKPAPSHSHSLSGRGKTRKKIVIVGKAVTFDSGGLSLKPADGMMTMKIDMAGAASVIGLFQALPLLDVDVEVHGLFLAVENMPSGSAYRPGDVVKAMNGTTIEVLNTDAEGRVTLADALSYAVTQKPDAIIDLATLTGACVVALGEEIAGLFTNDEKLGKRLLAAADHAGELLWNMPLHRSYEELIRSRVADIKNTGGRSGGAITAALFLQLFVGDVPWAHVDIAGPSYTEKETRPDQPFGGTGYGVRLLVRYLQGLS